MTDLRCLEDGGVEASEERKKKWAAQIRETVERLHEIGVIWGDGKPHNVLVHEETGDVWIIDFGGGYTQGWVDEEFKESVQGDEQAVERIMKYLDQA